MAPPRVLVLEASRLPDDPQWLGQQSCPVIAYGNEGAIANADVLVPDHAAALLLEERVQTWPVSALTLVQVLRCSESLPASLGLDIESFAYATLQSGEEFSTWYATQKPAAAEPPQDKSDAVLISREGSRLSAVLNRPDSRNAMSLEMREAWIEVLELLDADDAITELRFSARGACFSTGGELREFGSRPDPATAHWVRTVRSPARLLAKLGHRISFYLHGACLGSGIELPAFAARVIAHPKSYFQLPELQLGLLPGAGGTVSIARRIGRQRLAWMVLSGKRINAATALQWGLIDEIGQPDASSG